MKSAFFALCLCGLLNFNTSLYSQEESKVAEKESFKSQKVIVFERLSGELGLFEIKDFQANIESSSGDESDYSSSPNAEYKISLERLADDEALPLFKKFWNAMTKRSLADKGHQNITLKFKADEEPKKDEKTERVKLWLSIESLDSETQTLMDQHKVKDEEMSEWEKDSNKRISDPKNTTPARLTWAYSVSLETHFIANYSLIKDKDGKVTELQVEVMKDYPYHLSQSMYYFKKQMLAMKPAQRADLK